MIVSMWMSRDLITITPETLLTEASAMMARKHIRRLPVIEYHAGTPYPVGIITATDILHAYPPDINPFAVTARDAGQGRITASQIMSRVLQTIEPETPIEEAARLMRNEKISTLLVVQKKKLAGLITESDIFRAFVKMLESTGGEVRITFDIANEEDAFYLIAPMAQKFAVHVASLMSVRQNDRQLCVIRVAGANTQDLIDELWRSGHSVLNVLRLS